MILRLFFMVIVLALVGGGVWMLQTQKTADMAQMSSGEMPPAAVSVAEVRAEAWRQSLFAVGSIAAEQGINVTAPLPGTVVGIHFESGQQVERLQVLASLDVGVDMAELEGLIAGLELRDLQFERAKKLLKDRQISQADYDAARAARDEAAALLETKRQYIARKKVYAPFDGTLGIRMIDLGDHLEPGDPVVPLQMLDPIHADYAVPERFLSRLAKGQTVEIAVPAYPGEKFTGTITAFDPGIDPGTRNVRIRATFPNPDHRLRPGMFAEVWTVEAGAKNILSLPETAITYSPYGNTAFVVIDAEGGTTVERRQVKTGEVRDGRVEIATGLAAGERVVAVGQNKLRNGMTVQVVEQETAALVSDAP